MTNNDIDTASQYVRADLWWLKANEITLSSSPVLMDAPGLIHPILRSYKLITCNVEFLKTRRLQ
jgi:hypothetical protein